MWSWTLNWGQVTRTLLIGSCPRSPDDVQRIRHGTGATSVLSLQHDDCLAYWGIDEAALQSEGRKAGLTMLRCPIRDFDGADARRCLPEAVRLLAGFQSEGQRTYVHCTAGMGRAPVTVWGYLVLVEGWDPEEAYQRIKQGRPEAVPDFAVVSGCRDDLIERYRSEVEERARALQQQGVNKNSVDDWHQAVREVIREKLMP